MPHAIKHTQTHSYTFEVSTFFKNRVRNRVRDLMEFQAIGSKLGSGIYRCTFVRFETRYTFIRYRFEIKFGILWRPKLSVRNNVRDFIDAFLYGPKRGSGFYKCNFIDAFFLIYIYMNFYNARGSIRDFANATL